MSPGELFTYNESVDVLSGVSNEATYLGPVPVSIRNYYLSQDRVQSRSVCESVCEAECPARPSRHRTLRSRTHRTRKWLVHASCTTSSKSRDEGEARCR